VYFEMLPEGKPAALLRPNIVDDALPFGRVKKNTGKPIFRMLFLDGQPVADPVAVLLDAIDYVDLQHFSYLLKFLLIQPDVP
jgi:hypothetical protein